jgi:hypothetical protein
MKNLIAPPATVLALLAQESFDREQAKREIDETVARGAAVRAVVDRQAGNP